MVIVGVFLLFWLIISVVKAFRADHSITLKIKGINVKIEEGDIFESTDWKLIPFIFWFRAIWLRSKRLPFGAMRIGNDLEMSGVL